MIKKQFVALFKTMRPQQWIKNLFVFLPLFFSGNILSSGLLLRTMFAAIIFCLLSSSVYILNDILDRDQDRKDPTKRNRPIPSGVLPVRNAGIAAITLAVVSVASAFLLTPMFGYIGITYVILILSYSWKLKHVMIFDTLVIVVGFILRVLGGGAVINVHVSDWLFILVAFLSLFLALLKRRSEFIRLERSGTSKRKVLKKYTREMLDHFVTIATTGTIISYALYTVSRAEAARLRWSVLIVIFAMFRYLYIAFTDGNVEEAEKLIFKDKQLLASVVIFFLYMTLIIYGPSWMDRLKI